MLKKYSDKSEYIFILDNIRDEDEEELRALFGDKWYEKTCQTLQTADFYILYGKDFQNQNVPVAMGGVRAVCENSEAAYVWLLTTKYIYKNRVALCKGLKNFFRKYETKYRIMCNFIYKSNYTAKSWLKKFGFKFDNPKPCGMTIADGYEFFYKITKKEKKGKKNVC